MSETPNPGAAAAQESPAPVQTATRTAEAGAAIHASTEATSNEATLQGIENGQINPNQGLEAISEGGSAADLTKMLEAPSATVPDNPAERNQAQNGQSTESPTDKPTTQEAGGKAEFVAQRNAGTAPETPSTMTTDSAGANTPDTPTQAASPPGRFRQLRNAFRAGRPRSSTDHIANLDLRPVTQARQNTPDGPPTAPTGETAVPNTEPNPPSTEGTAQAQKEPTDGQVQPAAEVDSSSATQDTQSETQQAIEEAQESENAAILRAQETLGAENTERTAAQATEATSTAEPTAIEKKGSEIQAQREARISELKAKVDNQTADYNDLRDLQKLQAQDPDPAKRFGELNERAKAGQLTDKETSEYFRLRSELRDASETANLTAEQQTPGSESMVSTEPLSEEAVIGEARKQMLDGIITPEEAQYTINNAAEIAKRNSGNAPESTTPIPGLEAETPAQSNDQLLAQEANLQQQLSKGEITQEQYRNNIVKLAKQTRVGASQTAADAPEGARNYTVEDATIHEPTAYQRADGAKVTEDGESLELTSEQQARFDGMKLGNELTKIGVDPESVAGQKLMIELARDPSLMGKLILAKEGMTQIAKALGSEVAQQTAEATTDALTKQSKEAEAKGDTAKVSKLKGLIAIMLALIATGFLAVGGATALAAEKLGAQTK